MKKNPEMKKNKKNRKKHSQRGGESLGRKIGRFFVRLGIWLLTTLVICLAGAYVFFYYINKGPSEHLRDLFVTSVMESSAGGILASIYLSEDEIALIQQKNTTTSFDEITDTTLVDAMAMERARTASENSSDADFSTDNDPDGDGIELHEISGPMYRGMMMVVYDPSRVKVATIDNYTHSHAGKTLEDLIADYGAVGGINGGKYEDTAGMGIGGWPEGIVISDGELRFGDRGGYYGVYGFTNDNVLVCGNMSGQAALDMGVRDAVTFGPALIVNGVSASYSGVGSGLNPRTAIGQRADGAVLLLVIEGRKTSSMGATMGDLIEIMEEYGAVNAANLDGGMSSAMWYMGENVVSNSSIRGDRTMPTAFVVMPKED